MDLYLKCEVAFDYQNFISLTTVRGHCSRLIHPTTPKNVVYCVGYQRTVNPRSTCHILPPRVLLAFRPNSSHSFFRNHFLHQFPPPPAACDINHMITFGIFAPPNHFIVSVIRMRAYDSNSLQFAVTYFFILAVLFLPLFFA